MARPELPEIVELTRSEPEFPPDVVGAVVAPPSPSEPEVPPLVPPSDAYLREHKGRFRLERGKSCVLANSRSVQSPNFAPRSALATVA